MIDTYMSLYPKETSEALHKAEETIKELKRMGGKRYEKIHEELKEVHKNRKKTNLKDDALKRKLKGLFKFESDDQEIERKLIKSVIKKVKDKLDILDKEKRLSLTKQLEDLEKKIKFNLSEKDLKEVSDKVNDHVAKVYLEIANCKMQSLFERQANSIEVSCKLLEERAPDLVKEINLHRMRIGKYLKHPEQPILLRKIIEGNKDLKKYFDDEQNKKGRKHPDTVLIQLHLKYNQEILKTLKQLESEKKVLLINEEAINNYREDLEFCEKIKFALIEDDLLKAFKHETYDEEAIKKLLENAELEYCLAENQINSAIETKNNIKHLHQDLLPPLIDKLKSLIINNIPRNNENFIQRYKGWGKTLWGLMRVMASATSEESTERKTLNAAQDAYKKGEEFLKHFQSCFGEIGAFSDYGESFEKYVWPEIEDYLHKNWEGFFDDIEFKIGNGLDNEV